jgi:hypothetical protein
MSEKTSSRPMAFGRLKSMLNHPAKPLLDVVQAVKILAEIVSRKTRDLFFLSFSERALGSFARNAIEQS